MKICTSQDTFSPLKHSHLQPNQSVNKTYKNDGKHSLKSPKHNLPAVNPIKELVLGLNVGDIEAPRTTETLAKLSETVSPMSPNVKSFLE